MLCALCLPAQAQQPTKIPHIGYISGGGDPNNPVPRTAAFRQGLRGLGHVEGQNIQVDYRYILGQSGRIAGLVAELIQLPRTLSDVRAEVSIGGYYEPDNDTARRCCSAGWLRVNASA